MSKVHMTISLDDPLADQIKADVKEGVASCQSERIQTLLLLGYQYEKVLSSDEG